MNRERVREEDGKVFEVRSVIVLRTDYLNPGYEFSVCVPPMLRNNGHFLLFQFKPASEGLPHFDGRWDEDNRALDIDMRDALAGRMVLAFKRGDKGYFGHHTDLA